MSRNTFSLSTKMTAAIAVVALAAPAAALSRTESTGYRDLRSPDAVDAAVQAQRAQAAEYTRHLEAQRAKPGYVDLRSPDARDAGTVRPASTPSLEPTRSVQSGGFDWGDAGIGAGALLGLLMIALSVMFTVVHRRNHTPAL